MLGQDNNVRRESNMIEKIYEIEGINVESVDGSFDGDDDQGGQGGRGAHKDTLDPSFLSEDMPSFLRQDAGMKIHTIQELLEKSKPF